MDWYYQTYAAIVSLQKFINSELAAIVNRTVETRAIAPSLVGLALVLGMVHALTPGHGKSVIVSYFLGREANLRTGFEAAAKVAFAHITAAVVLVLIFGRAVSLLGRPAGAAVIVQTISFTVVAIMGVIYLLQALNPSDRAHHHVPSPLPFAVGLLPCPLTMLVVGHAFVIDAYASGLLLAALIGLGSAFTIGVFAAIGIMARRGVLGISSLEHAPLKYMVRGLEIGSSVLVLGLGVAGLLSIEWPRLL